MLSLLRHWFSQRLGSDRPGRRPRQQRLLFWFLSIGLGIGLSCLPLVVQAQGSDLLQQQEDQLIREFALPQAPVERPVYRPQPARSTAPAAAPPPRWEAAPAPAPEPAPVARPAVRPAPAPAQPAPAPAPTPEPAVAATPERETTAAAPTSEYVLEFNRDPEVGSRTRLQGIYPETHFAFSRPRNWQVKSAKAMIRFQHSPSLLANKSNLIVRVNDTSIGSVPLDRKQSQTGQVLFNIPPNLIQDYNDLAILAEQQTSEACSNPSDPGLWTEILPDSKITFTYEPQPIALDFNRYPYPVLDNLSLEPNQLAYLRPEQVSEPWLTAIARFQTSAGRWLDFRPLNSRMVSSTDRLQYNERLVVLGTPAEQPLLSKLNLPFPLRNGKVVDGNNTALPDDVGVLMLTTMPESGNLALVATGNAPEGVLKAVQFLVQSPDQPIGAGQALIVNHLPDLPSPPLRQWNGYLPTRNNFQLGDLTTSDHRKPFRDVTVHGTSAPPVKVDFRALPDDRIQRGSTMTLNYSYSPQVEPRTSMVEVKLDDVTIGSKRLTNANGGRESLNVALPGHLIQPTSKLDVQFILYPRRTGSCGIEADRQLWGTVHSDSTFNLKRDSVVRIPDLKLLQTGYPLTAPQDLSAAAIVLPDQPTEADLKTLLTLTQRLGRVSQSDSVKLQVYQASKLPTEVRQQYHLVGIGTRDRFPLPEALQTEGFNLHGAFLRQWQDSQIQTLPDEAGVIKSVISPWNRDRLLFALTGQTEQGLQEVQDLFRHDRLFFQMQGDTTLISRNQPNPSPYDPHGYNVAFLQEVKQQQIAQTSMMGTMSLFLQDHWFMLPTGMILLSLLLYGISQLFLNRVADSGDL